MNTKWLAMALLPVVAGAWAWAQEKNGSQKVEGQRVEGSNGGLVRVKPDSQGSADEEFDRDAWKKKLTAGNLEERERAFDRLAETARNDRNAREALEEWSKSGDSELAWTSRLLLREAHGKSHAFGFGLPRGGFGWKQGDDSKSFDSWGIDLDDFARRFNDLDSMFGDLRAQWDGMLQALPTPSGGSSTSESMSLQTGPDGVTCTITEKVDGKEETKQYEAKSMDELLEAHPELREKLGGGLSFQFHNFDPQHMGLSVPRGNVLRLSPRMHLRPDSSGDVDTWGTQGEPRTDVLGIGCTTVADGLKVESVYPGTIASLVGVREGDVVVEVNGAAIRERNDVKKALADRGADADVSIVVVGRDGQRRTLTWKPKT